MPDEVRGDLMQGPSGIPSEADYIALYCRRSGRILPTAWPVYLVIALFRLAAISQGAYHRGLQGNAASPAALSRRDTCRQLPGIAVRML